MPALTKSIYLAWKKPKLDQQVSFLAGFDRAKRILLRLAENSPYTLFSLYTAATLKKDKKTREITAIAPAHAEMLIEPLRTLFDEVITVEATPSYGSKAFKALREHLDKSKSKYDVYCDLDLNPLSELAILSGASMRMAYYDDKLYPFFNILFHQSGTTNLHERSAFVTRLLVDEEEIEKTMPKPKIDQTRASAWLKRHGLLRDKSFVLTSLPLEIETLRGMRVIPAKTWEDEPSNLMAALFTSAALYVGKMDRGFELSYLVGTPSILVIPEKEEGPELPPSPFVKQVIRTSSPSPTAIEQAIAGPSR
ncbi:hypothetical protein JXM67_13020 [candidate division WOR-3 bacterium]|nr:hypothetical protein [candidate division WOR-3 bacterium]